MKRTALRARSLANEVRFHPPSLRKLVETLEVTFAALYVQDHEDPDYDPEYVEDLSRQYKVLTDNAEKAVFARRAAASFKNYLRRENLADRDWMIKQFDAALQSMKLKTKGDVVARSKNECIPYGLHISSLTSKRKDPPTDENSVSKRLRGDPSTRQETASQRSQTLADVAEEESMTDSDWE
jgi:hypothetical protein